jgi:hypothetical protein
MRAISPKAIPGLNSNTNLNPCNCIFRKSRTSVFKEIIDGFFFFDLLSIDFSKRLGFSGMNNRQVPERTM